MKVRFLIGLTWAGLAVGACGSEPREEPLSRARQALTDLERTLSFERVSSAGESDWRITVGSGVLSQQSVHTHLQSSLGAAGVSYFQIESIPVSNLAAAGAAASVDVLVPGAGPIAFGGIQIFYDRPSRGVWNAPLAYQSLQDRAAGSFQTIETPLSASAAQDLSAAGPADLVLRVAVNVPFTSAPVLLDHLAFAASSGSSGAGGGGSGGGGGASGEAGSGGGGQGGAGGAGGSTAGGGSDAGASGSGGTGGSSGSGNESGTPFDFSIQLPHGLHREDVILGGGTLQIHDRVQAVNLDGDFASVSSVDSTTTSLLGVEAHVHDFLSESSIDVRNRAVIHGVARSSSNILTQPDSVIQGGQESNVSLRPLETTTWRVVFPEGHGGPVNLVPDAEMPLEPGAYGGASIGSRATLRLRTGTYLFDGPFVAAEPDSEIEIDDGAGPVLIYVRGDLIYRGRIVDATGTAAVLFGVTGQAIIDNNFRGVVVAPWGTITLASVGGAGHVGSWFGTEVIARPDSRLHHRAFSSQDFCGPGAACSELCPCPPGGFPCENNEQCQSGLACSADGVCACSSNCASKTCGSDPSDGCGSVCPGICGVNQIGCTTDLECSAGTVCIIGGGPQKGFPAHTNICLPAVCREMDPAQPNCNVGGADCGPCPACTPNCEGRACGPDGCGGTCGEEPQGEFCALGGNLTPIYRPIDDHTINFPTSIDLGDAQPVTQGVGAVPGSLQVTDRGTASYTVPIRVPPGRQGLQPDLSLNYSSTKANGLMGIGWSIGGLSMIKRCPRTIAQDGVAAPIELTVEDRFCIDGQRIVLRGTVPVPYGSASGEYRTEIENFSRISIIGPTQAPDGSYVGPRGFRVRTKDGRVLTYGSDGTSEDSIVFAGNVPRVWGLSKVQDRAGNEMIIRYGGIIGSLTEIPTPGRDANLRANTGELVPESIFYGAQPGASNHDRRINFRYKPRGVDPRHNFVAGYEASSNYLLDRIETVASPNLIHTYRLGYTQDAVDFAESRLTSVRMCAHRGAVETCLPETKFEFLRQHGFEEPIVAGVFSIGAGPIVMDVNGDGRDDILGRGASKGWWGLISSTGGRFPQLAFSGGPSDPNRILHGSLLPEDRCVSAESAIDLNRDGRDDLVDQCRDHAYVSQGDRFERQVLAVPPFDGVMPSMPSATSRFLADLNGDGLKDLVRCNSDRDALQFLPNTGIGFGSPISLPPTPLDNCHLRLVLDRDGDGDDDIISFGTDVNHEPQILQGVETANPVWVSAGFSHPPGSGGELFGGCVGRVGDVTFPRCGNFVNRLATENFRLMDVNGDGLKDILQVVPRNPVGQSEIVLWVNTGIGFAAHSTDLARELPALVTLTGFDHPVPSFVHSRVYDYDGDGREDLLLLRPTPHSMGNVNVLRSTAGLGFQKLVGPPWGSVPGLDGIGLGPLLPDLNGDGSPELALVDGLSRMQVRLGRSAQSGLMRDITDGLGRFHRIGYSEFGAFSEPTYDVGGACTFLPDSVCLRRVAPLASNVETGQIEHPSGGGTQIKSAGQERYSYLGARAGLEGRGWFGFTQRVKTTLDPTNQFFQSETRQYRNTDFALAGRVRLIQRRTAEAPAGQLNNPYARTTTIFNSWEMFDAGFPNGDFPWLGRQEVQVTDNMAVSSTVIVQTPDFNGNVHDSMTTVRAGDGDTGQLLETRHVHTVYTSFAEPDAQTVTSTRDGNTVTRNTDFTYYANGLLKEIIREPGQAQNDPQSYYLRTFFDRDPVTSNIERIESSGADGATRATEIVYDSRGLFPTFVTQITGTAPELHTTELHFDEGFGVLLTSMDPNQRITRYFYDGFGRPRRVRFPTHELNVSYEDADVTFDVPYVGGVWGAMKVVAESFGNGYVEQITDAFGRVVQRRTGGFDGTLVEEELERDWAGRVLTATLPHEIGDETQGATSYVYDPLGRLSKVIFPDSRIHSYEYSSRGSQSFQFADKYILYSTLETHPNGTFEFSAFDHVGLPVGTSRGVSLLSPDAASNRYTYAAFNLPRSVQDPDGRITTFDTDRLGRVQRVTDPDMGVQDYVFNAFGDVIEHTDAENATRCFTQDTLGRLERIESGHCGGTPGAIIARFDFDGEADNEVGRLISTFRPSSPGSVEGSTVRYHYEPRPASGANKGLLSAIERTVPGLAEPLTTSFEYAGPRLSSITYPAAAGQQFSVSYDYDSHGNLRSVTEGANDPIWELVEAEQGIRPKLERFGNDIETAFDYFALNGGVPQCNPAEEACIPGMLRSIHTDLAGDTNPGSAQALEYGYDRMANVAFKIDSSAPPFSKNDFFEYDVFDRLKEHTFTEFLTSATTSYRYQRGGNIESVTGDQTGPISGTYTYDPQHPHAVASAGGRSFTYDANGNQLTRSGPGIPGGAQLLSYNDFNMPWKIEAGDLGTTFLEYDAGEQRIAKRGPLQTTIYAGDLYECAGATPIVTGQQFGCAEHRYKIYAGGKLVAQVTKTESGGVITGTEKRFMHSDHLGSATAITDESGDVVDRRSFDPFGRSTEDFSATSVRSGYTGHEQDPELGLVNMKGRLYDADVRRFVTADPFIAEPFDTQGLNPYSYVGNNPINFIDPSGFVIERPFPAPAPTPLEPQPDPQQPGPQGPTTGPDPDVGNPRPQGEGPQRAGEMPGYSGPPQVPTGAEGPNPGDMPQGPLGESVGGSPQSGAFPTGADAPNGTPRNAGGDWPGGARGGVGSDPNAPMNENGGERPGALGNIGVLPIDCTKQDCSAMTVDVALDALPGTGVVIRIGKAGAAAAGKFVKWLLGKGAAGAAPKIPFKGFQEWGRPLWGRGAADARKAIDSMTPDIAKAIDPAKAQQALEFYKQAAAAGRGGEAAAERVRLMERILELQK